MRRVRQSTVQTRYWLALLLAVLTAALLPAIAWAGEPDGKSGVTPNTIKLPDGPGTLEGIGQSFEPDLNSGTAVFNVPLEVPPGRAGHQPDLNLAYNSGWGQSEVGLGWRISVPCLQRQTDKGLPTYTDADTLIYTEGGQELIALDDGTLRFKIEGGFTRFTWISPPWTGGIKGGVRNGVKMFFGQSPNARITTADGVFMWCVDTITDPNGNVIDYEYVQHGNRPYLSEIRYNEAADGTAQTVHVFYEERPDIVTSFQSGEGVTLDRRVRRVEMRSREQLVRAYDLAYHDISGQSLLASVTQVGRDGESTLPPLSFTYTQFAPQIHPLTEMLPPPPGAPGGNLDLVMLDNDPLPDLIFTASGDHRYLLNQGRGRWADHTVKMTHPDTGALSSPSVALESAGVFMMDADGNGFADLAMVGSGGAMARYWPNDGREFWESPVDFMDNPNFSFEDANVRLSDQDHDKRIDILATEPNGISCWLNQGEAQWSDRIRQPAPDPDQVIQFENPQVQLGDFNGDGLDDLALVRSRSVSYYPGRGRCQFGARVEMANPPDAGALDAQALRVADVNSDGRADLVTVDYAQVTYFLNLGDAWSDGVVIPNTPRLRAKTVLRFADMDASGTVDLLFVDGLRNQYQYLDFAGGVRPNLLTQIDNALGQVIDIHYRSSTDYLLDARDAGEPWHSPMPLAISVVSQVDVTDQNSDQTYTTRYVYSEGAWDGDEHEFRGFAWVDKIEEGGDGAPTTVTRFHFDTGLDEEVRKGQVLEQSMMGEGGQCVLDASYLTEYGPRSSGVLRQAVDACYNRQVNTVAARTLTTNVEGEEVRFAYVEQTDTYLYEGTSTPRQLRQTFAYDDWGNVTREFNYGEVMGDNLGHGEDELLTYYTYAINESRWIVNRPAAIVQRDMDGNFVSEKRLYYDGPPHVGLPLGVVMVGNLTRQSASLGPEYDGRFVDIVRNRYDGYGNIVEIQDANGNLRTLGYDAVLHTFPVRETVHLTDDRTLEITAAYDLGLGAVTLANDFGGATTLYTWDGFGRLDSIVRPGDNLAYPTQAFSYTLANPVSHILVRTREQSGAPATRQQATFYDGLGRQLMVQQEAEDGQVAVTEAVLFNARGSAARRFYPYYAPGPLSYRTPEITRTSVALSYDPVGRVIQEQEPDGALRRVRYLPLQEAHFDEEDTRSTSPHFNTSTTYVYDGLERLRGVQEIDDVSTLFTSYDYDPLERLTRIVDAQGNITTQIWDGLGRKREMVSPDAGRRAYTYDDAGNLIQTEDAKGQVVDYRYDAANRIVAEDFVGTPGEEIVYHYDSDISTLMPDAAHTLGRLSYIEDMGGVEAFSYDARGNVIARLRTIEDRQFLTRMTFDASDRPVSLTYPDGMVVDYAYNAFGVLESIPGYVDNLDYTAAGQLKTQMLANGLITRHRFDLRQRLLTLKTTGYGETYQSLSYRYDDASNITAITDHRPDRTLENDMTALYTYDSLYRLTSDRTTGGQTLYEHDGIGNIITQTSTTPEPRLNLGEIAHGQDAGPHAPTTVGDDVYTYDANGNLSAKPGLTMTFDYRDRLISATTESGAHLTFLYDANNLRLLKRVQYADGSESVVYYPDQYSEVRDGEVVNYVWAGERRVAQIEPAQSKKYFFHLDHLNSTHLMSDHSGQMLQETLYHAYGSARLQSDMSVAHYMFAGKEIDAQTELYYFSSRYYVAKTGDFISLDPFYINNSQEEIEKPQTLNLYAYTLNNPLRFTDPTGEKWQDFLRESFSDVAKLVQDNYTAKIQIPLPGVAKFAWDQKGNLTVEANHPALKFLKFSVESNPAEKQFLDRFNKIEFGFSTAYMSIDIDKGKKYLHLVPWNPEVSSKGDILSAGASYEVKYDVDTWEAERQFKLYVNAYFSKHEVVFKYDGDASNVMKYVQPTRSEPTQNKMTP
jgi:RHS repeat-associated protein